MDEKDFGLRLARLREKKGISARDMSLSMGQNASYVNHIETGKSMPSLSGILMLCEHLEITPSEFFDTAVENPGKIKEIVSGLKKLNDSQLDTVASVVNSLLQK